MTANNKLMCVLTFVILGVTGAIFYNSLRTEEYWRMLFSFGSMSVFGYFFVMKLLPNRNL